MLFGWHSLWPDNLTLELIFVPPSNALQVVGVDLDNLTKVKVVNDIRVNIFPSSPASKRTSAPADPMDPFEAAVLRLKKPGVSGGPKRPGPGHRGGAGRGRGKGGRRAQHADPHALQAIVCTFHALTTYCATN